MARRIRTIKPEILEDEKTATLPHDTWRLFVSLWLLADDYGNLRASPKLIDGAVFWAHDDADVPRMLTELGDAGLLAFYTVRGQRYAHISGWKDHQRVDHPGKPVCPGPEEASSVPEASHETLASDSRESRESLASDSRLTGTGIRTRKGGDPPAPARDPGGTEQVAPPPPPPPRAVTEAGEFDPLPPADVDPDLPAVEPDNPRNLVAFMTRVARDERPTIGPWFPGRFADRDAAAFFAAVMPRRDPATVKTIGERVHAFFRGPSDDGWPLKEFVDRFNADLARAPPPKRPTVVAPANWPKSRSLT